MAFNDTYVESIQTKHVSNVGFTSTAKGVTNEAFALKNPHQVLSSQIPFIDVVSTYGPLVASGIAAGVAEEHIVKLTADPTVNGNKAWIAYETNCTVSGHSTRGALRVDKWMRYAETQYKLRLYEDNGSSTAPDYSKEILPSEVNFNWEYDASAGIVYFDADPDTTKIIPLWGVFYTYIGGTVEEAIITAANSIPDVSYLSFDCYYVDDYNWRYNSSGNLIDIPGSLSVFVNGVKQRDNDPDYYTATISGGIINLEFGFKVRDDDWVNIEYLTSEGGGSGSGESVSLPDSGTTANVILIGDGDHGFDVSTATLELLSNTTLNGPASTTVAGPVELATNAETIIGTDTERAVTPAGLAATLLGAGGSKNNVYQVGHGFDVGDVLYLEGGTYAKAIATDVSTAEVVGIVSDVAGADDFTILSVGYVEGLFGLTAGMIYFLSDSVSGTLTSIEPTVDGYVSKPMLIADSSDSGYFFNMRGVAIGGSSLDDMFAWSPGTQEITFKGHLIPESDDTFNIGRSDRKIAELFVSASTIHIGDNATFSGTSLVITGDPNASTLANTPTVQASSLILRPFTYNPGGGAVTSNPKLEFINTIGAQYGISFNTASNEFSFDAPTGVSEGVIKAKKITAGTIETTGTEQIIFEQNFRTDGNVILGYDENNTIVLKGTVDLRTPIVFSQTATLGDGNDNIGVNCGTANYFTTISKNYNINSSGLLTTSGINLSGDIVVGGNGTLQGQTIATQTYVNTISGTLDTKIDGKEPVFSKNTAFNKSFGTGGSDVCVGNDSRLSDARTPTSHDNTYHSATYITTAGVTYEALSANGDVGSSASTLCAGNDSRLSDARTPASHNNTYHSETYITTAGVTYETLSSNGDIGSTASTLCAGNDSRLSDARTPTSHNNTYHSETYITSTGVTYETLNSNGDVGSSASTLCAGNDSRLSDARTPTSHNNTYHSETYITSVGVTYETLNSNGDVGSSSGTLCAGNDSRLSDARTPVSHDHNDLYYTESEIDTISGTINSKIESKLDIVGGNITGNLTVGGDFSVQGNNFLVNTQTVTAEDNLIVINSAEAGAGVTAGVAGIEVERGSLTNYMFYFDEGQDNFRVGVSGTLQAVATREDSPISNGVAVWNSTAYRFDTETQGTAFNKSFGTGGSDVCVGNDSRLSDARTPTSHDNTYHSATYITVAGVTYETLSSNGDIGTTASTLCAGNDSRLSDARTPTSHDNTYHSAAYITTTGVTYEALSANGDVGSTASTLCAGNDSRLSDARTPTSHDNTYHSATYITSAGVNYTNLNANSSVGTGSTQVAQGDHTHSYLPLSGGQLTGNLSITGTTKADSYFYAGSSDPTNTTRLNYDGYFYATRVYNAYLNDIADFQKIISAKVPGKCYYDSIEGAEICFERCQKSVIGILSDTYGMAVGYQHDEAYGPIAIAGWVLAYVDGLCEPGDVLTNGANGNLVKMTREEKLEYPERIVAIYKKPETAETWGTKEVKVVVNGRHWVKVR